MRRIRDYNTRYWIHNVFWAFVSLLVFGLLFSAFIIISRDFEVNRVHKTVDVFETADNESVSYEAFFYNETSDEIDLDYILDVPLDVEFQIYLHDLCEEYKVPYTLAVAVIEQESHYTADAVSPTNDYGLMQINKMCHEWLMNDLNITDFLDPYQNVKAGVYILSIYYATYKYDSGTLMAYNMGQYGAEKLFAQGIYNTWYSDSVINIRWRLETFGK